MRNDEWHSVLSKTTRKKDRKPLVKIAIVLLEDLQYQSHEILRTIERWVSTPNAPVSFVVLLPYRYRLCLLRRRVVFGCCCCCCCVRLLLLLLLSESDFVTMTALTRRIVKETQRLISEPGMQHDIQTHKHPLL
jgi:hypothetical protein